MTRDTIPLRRVLTLPLTVQPVGYPEQAESAGTLVVWTDVMFSGRYRWRLGGRTGVVDAGRDAAPWELVAVVMREVER